jgi:ubiquinone/menaquinone biosynthesis C-methylase UbiE
MPDAQREFYNAAYPMVQRHAAELPGWLRPFETHRTQVALHLLPPGRHLLDIGCGDGDLIARASPLFERVVGLEVADTQVAKARTRVAHDSLRNATLVQANVDRGLPFGQGQFDAVSAIAVLAFVFDPLALISEIARVLRPAGYLVLEVLNLGYAPRRLAVLRGGLPGYTTCHGWEGGHLHNFTRHSIATLLEANGFEVLRVTGSGTFAGLRTWWSSMLLGNVIVLAGRR